LAATKERKINWVWIAVAAVIIILVVVIVYLASCQGEETTTTTTAQAQIPPGTEVVKLTETSNGKTVTVSPGYLLILELTGYPSQGYQWDVVPPDPEVVKGLPGPAITPDQGNTPGTYTFSGIALALGTTDVSADYVSPQGKTDKSYKVTINVVSSVPTSSTTTSASTTTTTQATTTTASSTTTTSSSTTTTTQAPTTSTMTASTTTTTSGSTTTTAKPTTTTTAKPTTTTTTAKPTTTTTAKPTTTTTAKPTTTTTTAKPTTTTTAKPTTTTTAKPSLPPTTSTSFIQRPPTEQVPGNTYLDERNNGQVVYAAAGAQLVVTLGGDQSSPYKWSIKKIDSSVLKSTGNPTFTPVAGAKTGAPGVYTFTFDVLKADASTELALVYADSSGNVNQYFYVGIVTTKPQVTPY
jgi:predicted secreted protein